MIFYLFNNRKTLCGYPQQAISLKELFVIEACNEPIFHLSCAFDLWLIVATRMLLCGIVLYDELKCYAHCTYEKWFQER